MTFAAELTVTALVAVAPLANTEVRGQVLEKGLKDVARRSCPVCSRFPQSSILNAVLS